MSLWEQHLAWFIYIIYVRAASGYVVGELEGVQTRPGSDARPPRQARCCGNALCAFGASNPAAAFYHFAIQQNNPCSFPSHDDSVPPDKGFLRVNKKALKLPSPPVARCHNTIRKPSQHEIYLLPFFSFPGWRIRGSIIKKLFGIFTPIKNFIEKCVCLKASENPCSLALSETSVGIT